MSAEPVWESRFRLRDHRMAPGFAAGARAHNPGGQQHLRLTMRSSGADSPRTSGPAQALTDVGRIVALQPDSARVPVPAPPVHPGRR